MALKMNSRSKSGSNDREFMVKNPCSKDEIFDIRGVKVLSKNDWNRLQYRVHQHEYETEKERMEKEKREKLKQASHNIVKDWTNTVMGARQKKLEERRLRLEREEEERKKQDVAEAEYQAEKRKKAIEEAKRKQYYQTDRVKNFHSALTYAEVLKERDAQVELKRLRELAECNKDDFYVAKAKREFEEALKADQEKTAERIRKNMENTSFIKSQIKYNQVKKDKEMEEWLTEGENIRRLAISHALEKQRLDQIEREEQRLNRKDLLQQISDVCYMKQVDRLKNEEDDEEIRIFAAAKKKMMKLRMAKERQMAEEKHNHLESIKQKLSSQMKLKIDDEDDRIKKAISEKEQLFQEEEAEKQRKRMEALIEINKFRDESMNRIEMEKLESRQRDFDSLMARKQADAVLRENEAKRSYARLEEARKLAMDNLDIANNLKNKDEFSRGNQLKIMEENQRMLNLEEQVFQEYAQKVIEHCEKGGRNTYPLRVAAARGIGGGLGPVLPGGAGAGCLRPSYKSADGKEVELPSYQTNSTKEIKQAIQTDSNNNLGFVWTDEK